jgi:hypothetical protein
MSMEGMIVAEVLMSSSGAVGAGAAAILISPSGIKLRYAARL